MKTAASALGRSLTLAPSLRGSEEGSACSLRARGGNGWRQRLQLHSNPLGMEGGGATDRLAYLLCRSPRAASALRVTWIAVSLDIIVVIFQVNITSRTKCLLYSFSHQGKLDNLCEVFCFGIILGYLLQNPSFSFRLPYLIIFSCKIGCSYSHSNLV